MIYACCVIYRCIDSPYANPIIPIFNLLIPIIPTLIMLIPFFSGSPYADSHYTDYIKWIPIILIPLGPIYYFAEF